MAPEAGDPLLEPVDAGKLPGEPRDSVLFDRVNPGGAGSTRQHSQNARPRREVDDDVSGLDDLAERTLVRRNAMAVAQVGSMLVDYARHVAEDEVVVRSSGRKRSEASPPMTTRPSHSTQA